MTLRGIGDARDRERKARRPAVNTEEMRQLFADGEIHRFNEAVRRCSTPGPVPWDESKGETFVEWAERVNAAARAAALPESDRQLPLMDRARVPGEDDE